MEDYKWLEVFDKKDLIKFLREILPDLYVEIEENFNYNDLSGHLYTIDNILHEWKELSFTIQSTEVQEDFKN